MPDTEDDKEKIREKVAAENSIQLYKRYSERDAAKTIGWDYSTLKRKRRPVWCRSSISAVAQSGIWAITSQISSFSA